MFLALPSDVLVAKDVAAKGGELKSVTDVEDDEMILDIGEVTAKRFVAVIETAGTVIWNGTMGFAENEAFAKGSAAIAEAMASRSDIDTIIGGGDTADFAIHWDKKKGESFSHVSTGGGASLELMAGEKLPGIEHLLDA